MCSGILEWIVVDWNRIAVPRNRVNPLYFNKIDRILGVGVSPAAVAGDHDPVGSCSRRRRARA
jgi:hypothetical protein